MADLPSGFPMSMLEGSDYPSAYDQVDTNQSVQVTPVLEGDFIKRDPDEFSITGVPGAVISSAYINPGADQLFEAFGPAPTKTGKWIQKIDSDVTIDPQADVVIFPNVQTKVTMPALKNYPQTGTDSTGLIRTQHMIMLVNPHRDAMHILRTNESDKFGGDLSNMTLDRQRTIYAFPTATHWELV